ncbi:ABC transporter ATP-binding protein [Arachnia propionica]|uniref:ABC transporter ATP-binding protein n=2 Tax=Arachnia propionica TaxID=1750 RepID=A0A3P1TBV9_9ACTN|nr:ABC transporter ATP-binding protein [Arachnia propionica]
MVEPTTQPPRTVWDLIASARGSMILAFCLAAAGAVLKVVPYIALVEIARRLLSRDLSPGPLWSWVLVAVVSMLLHVVLYGTALGRSHVAEAKLRAELRQRLVDTLGQVNLGWFTSRSSGQIRKSVAKDTAEIHVLVAHLAGDLANAVFSLLASLVYLFWLDWRFALLLLGGTAVLLVVVYFLSMTGLAETYRAYGESERELSHATVELVDGIKEVKNFGMADRVFGRFDRAQKHHEQVSVTWLERQGLGMSLVAAAMQPAVVFTVTVAVGLLCTLQGWLDPVTVVAFALVWVGLPEGMTTLADMSQRLYTAKQAATNTLAILQAPRLPEPEVSLPAVEDAPAVELRDVSFAYEKGINVIEGLSLSCPKGCVTALVGPSGGGKSTVAKLISRFWDVDSGQILISGRDVRQLRTSDLMSSLSLVFQEVRLSHDTVRANIALGRDGATDEEIEEAARAACIHDRIMQLPDGYDTVIGEQAHLSGGEAQRLTIARAFLAAAPILILDEATAQADAHSERLIQQAISNLAVGRTVIVIAHRLGTIQGADQIAVIDGGRLIECGTHDDLVAAEGRYAQMWRGQQPVADNTEEEPC